MDVSDVPAAVYQIFAPAITALIIGVYGAFTYFRNARKADAPTDQYRMLGAALGDSQALERLRDELREMRTIIKDGAANTGKTNELLAEITDEIKHVTEAIRGLKFPARRRGQ